jgi:hypothetical protein
MTHLSANEWGVVGLLTVGILVGARAFFWVLMVALFAWEDWRDRKEWEARQGAGQGAGQDGKRQG